MTASYFVTTSILYCILLVKNNVFRKLQGTRAHTFADIQKYIGLSNVTKFPNFSMLFSLLKNPYWFTSSSLKKTICSFFMKHTWRYWRMRQDCQEKDRHKEAESRWVNKERQRDHNKGHKVRTENRKWIHSESFCCLASQLQSQTSSTKRTFGSPLPLLSPFQNLYWKKKKKFPFPPFHSPQNFLFFCTVATVLCGALELISHKNDPNSIK